MLLEKVTFRKIGRQGWMWWKVAPKMLTVTVVTLHWGIIKLSAKCSLWLIWAEAGITTWQFAAWCHGWQAAAGELHLSCCWSVGRGNRKIVTSMCWQPRPAPCCQLRSLSVWAELACGEWTPVPHPTIHWPLLGRRDGVYSTYYKINAVLETLLQYLNVGVYWLTECLKIFGN